MKKKTIVIDTENFTTPSTITPAQILKAKERMVKDLEEMKEIVIRTFLAK